MRKRNKFIIAGGVLFFAVMVIALVKYNQAMRDKDVYVAPPTQTVTKKAVAPVPVVTPVKKVIAPKKK